MRCNHFHAFALRLLIELVAVVRAISNWVLGLLFDHVEVEAQLHRVRFVMIRSIGGNPEPQTVTIRNRGDFHSSSVSRRINSLEATLVRCKSASIKRSNSSISLS